MLHVVVQSRSSVFERVQNYC